MMKKIISGFLVIVLIIVTISLPIEVKAKTISEFEAEVAKYTAELQAKKDKIAKNDEEVAAIKSKISSIEAQITEIENNIATLQREIEESNQKIIEKEEESKRIIEYYQIANGENAYLEYAFGASTITDMIYRMSIVEQLTEYNKQIMEELKELIAENKQKKSELSTKRGELETLEKELQEQKEKINADTASIKETMPALEDQIKAAKANVSYFKKLGCSQNEDIQACQYRVEQSNSSSGGGGGTSIASTNGFFRPIEYGYVTQPYKGLSHMGIDVSSSNKTIPVYPIASGQVFFVGYDSAGARVVKIKHNVNGRYLYSTYAHQSSFSNISKGSYISHTTSIGNMGSSGNSTGPHLHLEITTCDWNTGGGCTWAQYQNSTINPTTYVSFPSSWNNR